MKNDLVGGLTSGTDIFVGGFNLSAAALSQYDMSPLSASEITSFLSIAQAGTGTLPAIVQVLKDMFVARLVSGFSLLVVNDGDGGEGQLLEAIEILVYT